uniref:Olfactory receptor family 6 subfamily C member 65 n=1 Tax=Nannospalax galili TaxID=1026970 RepID=A0A8C6W7Z1_NANGA
MPNRTAITEFILLGLTDDPEFQVVIFCFMLITYLLSVSGNTTIIMLTLSDVHLKTPMYFFLRNFSFLEISFTTLCIPRFLISIATGSTAISYNSSICKPLHYTAIMNHKVCNHLVIGSWSADFVIISPPVIMGLQLEFCDSNIIDHFTCDSSPMLQIASVFTLILTLALVILSYELILRTILKLPSAQERKKAFSTCSSHVIVVSISYGSCIFMYIKNLDFLKGVALNKGVAVLNTSVAPMLNPFIYTLRNQQVKQAFKDFTKKMLSSNEH